MKLVNKDIIHTEIPSLFRTLKENGVKIAVNTSESREAAVNDLMAVGLTPFVDILVCGDDPTSRIKPDPQNAFLICEEMKASPDKTVVVGDTLEDITMGMRAKVSTCHGSRIH